MRAITLLILLTLIVAAFPLASARSEGAYGVAPVDVPFGDALRGEPLHRAIDIQNDKDQPVDIELRAVDETGAWALPLERNFTLPARSSREVALRMLVPADTPNGHYDGSLYVHFLPNSTVEAGTSAARLVFAVRVNITVDVGGPQRQRLEAGGLFVPDTEEGRAPTFHWHVKNSGNVRATPEAIVALRHADGTMLASERIVGPTLTPGSTENVTFRLHTTLTGGQYVLEASLAPPGDANVREEAWFEALEAGSLRRSGTLGAIALYDVGTRTQTHRIPFGNTIEIRAPFNNTGEIAVRATLRGYVALDGKAIHEFASDELLVDPGESTEIRMRLPELPRAGQYLITSEVAYSGKITPPQDAILILEDVRTEPPRAETPGGGWVVLLAGFVAAAAAQRHRRGRP